MWHRHPTFVSSCHNSGGNHSSESRKLFRVSRKFLAKWNTYFPKPDLQSDRLLAGDVFFFRAIDWILAHEVGHIASGHDNRAWTAQQSRDEESEADRFATCYVIGGLAAEPGRQPGQRPSQDEIELERWAIAPGLGLIWVAIYENTRTQDTDMYPAVAARIDDAMAGFGLADDSAALEILSDFIKAWIDPRGNGQSRLHRTQPRGLPWMRLARGCTTMHARHGNDCRPDAKRAWLGSGR